MSIQNSEEIKEIQYRIAERRIQDKKRLNNLRNIALSCVILRVVLGLILKDVYWINLLWLPGILYVFALPFYGFENLLDRIHDHWQKRKSK